MKTMILILGLATIPAGIAMAAGALADMDTDGNGMLSLAELQVAYPDVTEDVFKTIDANADGSVDDGELTAATDAGKLVKAAN